MWHFSASRQSFQTILLSSPQELIAWGSWRHRLVPLDLGHGRILLHIYHWYKYVWIPHFSFLLATLSFASPCMWLLSMWWNTEFCKNHTVSVIHQTPWGWGTHHMEEGGNFYFLLLKVLRVNLCFTEQETAIVGPETADAVCNALLHYRQRNASSMRV